MAKILVVDDNPAVCTALQMLFEIHGMLCIVAHSPDAALAYVRKGGIGVVVQDMNFTRDTTSGGEGIRLFQDIRAIDPTMPVLLMTAWTTVETAVRMVKAGANDYIQKPWDDARLVETVAGLLTLKRPTPPPDPQALRIPDDLVVESDEMRALVKLALRVAASDVPVLISGPNGAGKGGLARLVQANSRRAAGPFVTMDAGALSEQLLEAELFGSEAGAFTGANKRRIGRFEVADGGTLFLDEIGNLSPSGQMKLLRVLQTGAFERVGSNTTRTVDVRIISATNVDLPAAIAAGTFREDLYFRLNVIELVVPALAQRPADVLPLARHFLTRFTAPHPPPRLSRRAEAALLAHAWPGNVRELRNCMQRAALLADGGLVDHADLGLVRPMPRVSRSVDQPRKVALTETAPEESAEASEIRLALERADGRIATAAAALGLSRQALYRRMERLNIVVERRPRTRT